jgi:ketosteroid isomerase-like protein
LRNFDTGRLGEVGVADVIRGYVAALNAGDVDAVVAHVTADFVSEHTSAIGESFTGRDEYRARLPKFFALLPECHYEIEDLVIDGDRAAVPYTLRAAAVVVRGVFLFTCRDGLIARRVDYWDSAEFLRQLDAT